jgi:hypothetical protein
MPFASHIKQEIPFQMAHIYLESRLKANRSSAAIPAKILYKN